MRREVQNRVYRIEEKFNIDQKDSFIARENMTSVYELASVSDLSDQAYYHFMNCEGKIRSPTILNYYRR